MEPHLKILHAVAQAVSRTLDVDEVLRTAVEELTHVTGHEISSLHLLSQDGTTLHLRGERGLSEQLRQVNHELPVGRGVIGSVAATGVTARFDDMSGSREILPAAKDVVQRDRIRGFVCVPIRSRGQILGTLSLGRQTVDRFEDNEVVLVEATADQIGVALDNARLYSETRRQLEQLLRAEKLSAVGELASGVAHEINNPLTTILGQSQLILSRDDISDYIRDRVTIMAEEASRAARIVQSLLLFARHYPPERRPCSLADQVERVLELKGYQLQGDAIEIVRDFQPCPIVYADENQIQQVLLNLIQNAHQAMTQQTNPRELTVRIRPVAPMVFIEVLDTGPGISAEALPRLFDPFFTTKPPGEGSGLGLSVSYGIVAEHGGKLRAENRREGGAIFTVELPSGDRS